MEPENPSPEIKVTISSITAAEPAEPLEALEPENPSPEIKVTTSPITAAEPKNSSQFGSTYNEQHIQQHLCYCMKCGNCISLLICASAIYKTII